VRARRLSTPSVSQCHRAKRPDGLWVRTAKGRAPCGARPFVWRAPEQVAAARIACAASARASMTGGSAGCCDLRREDREWAGLWQSRRKRHILLPEASRWDRLGSEPTIGGARSSAGPVYHARFGGARRRQSQPVGETTARTRHRVRPPPSQCSKLSLRFPGRPADVSAAEPGRLT
jgi:hypothetical protein